MTKKKSKDLIKEAGHRSSSESKKIQSICRLLIPRNLILQNESKSAVDKMRSNILRFNAAILIDKSFLQELYN